MPLYSKTTAYEKIARTQKRLRIIQGGTAAGKTVAILMYLIREAILDEKPTLTSIVSESFPHLKRGAIRDFLNIMEAQEGFETERWNKTDSIYTYPNGSKIEFFSADQPAKVRGPRRNRLFVNEANNVPFETFEQLEVRTTEYIFIDYNPVAEFWVQTEIIGKRDSDFLVFTYKDNEVLNQNIIRSIESRKDNPRWWRVYGEGELGEAIGRIYTGWQVIDEVPHEARLERYGLDFGWNPDPVALIAIYYYNGGYILDEILYGLEVPNSQVASTISNLPKALTIADSAEPKSIAEIQGFKVNIVGTPKGSDSKRYGIKVLQGQRISMTQRSINLIKEYRNYYQLIDRLTNQPVMGETDGADDCLDAVRYAICSLTPIKQRQEMRRQMGQQQWNMNQQPTNPV